MDHRLTKIAKEVSGFTPFRYLSPHSGREHKTSYLFSPMMKMMMMMAMMMAMILMWGNGNLRWGIGNLRRYQYPLWGNGNLAMG